MQLKIFEVMSTALKLASMVVGALAVLYGLFVGVLGFGPDGPGVPFHLRMLGIWVLILGALYFVPNKKLKRHRWSTFGYIGWNLLPTIALGIASFVTLTESGMETFVGYGGLLSVSVFVPLSLFAPLSLIFSMLGARQEKAVSRPEEPVSCSGTVGSSSGDQSPERSDGTTVHSHKSRD